MMKLENDKLSKTLLKFFRLRPNKILLKLLNLHKIICCLNLKSSAYFRTFLFLKNNTLHSYNTDLQDS